MEFAPGVGVVVIDNDPKTFTVGYPCDVPRDYASLTDGSAAVQNDIVSTRIYRN